MKLNTLNKNKILKNIDVDRVNIAIYNTIGSTNDECKSLEQKNDFNIVLVRRTDEGKRKNGQRMV